MNSRIFFKFLAEIISSSDAERFLNMEISIIMSFFVSGFKKIDFFHDLEDFQQIQFSVYTYVVK